ncbi:OTU4 [Symbiodinium microadriaticum]|nr:OTU4 [Symbiodinium microadriaticum]
MSRLGSWGGEPELLVLSQHVLKRPIEVYMQDVAKPFLVYAQELPGEPVRILFHGYGHYEALVPQKI